MNVTYFREQRPGPELLMENVVVGQLYKFVASEEDGIWAAGSLPIGAGHPDLTIAAYKPEVFSLSEVDIKSSEILGYLRSVNCAHYTTIGERIDQSGTNIFNYLDQLIEIGAVTSTNDIFKLSINWRDILSEIVTIEVKVKNWQDAVSQAARNSLFSHRSYIALPTKVATRVSKESIFKKLGLGLLSVDEENSVKIIRRPRRKNPRIWSYYYRIASVISRHCEG